MWRRLKDKSRSEHRVQQREPQGMQIEARILFSAIGAVSGNRVADRGEVRSYLMGTPGEGGYKKK